MSITFNNQVFPTGYVGEDDGAPKSSFGLDNISTNSITINGTVTKVGDTVTATGLLPGSGDSGDTNTVNTLYVSQYDNSGQILFSDTPPATQGPNSFRYVLSNSMFSGADQQKVSFTTDQALVSGTGTDTYAVCFTTGTLIRTARGNVAVEALAVGDLAVTASGTRSPIRWIGHRALDGRGRSLPHDQQPVRIRQGAFGRDASGAALPARDLMLSPGHPVLVGADADREGGHLVPIMCLINGTTVERVAAESVTYWHVELDSHDILLAEGLPAESYLDWGDRAFFSQAPAHALANPDFVVPGLAGRCRPVAVDGPVVEAERRRLDAVFAASLATQCGWDEAQRWACA